MASAAGVSKNFFPNQIFYHLILINYVIDENYQDSKDRLVVVFKKLLKKLLLYNIN